MVHYLQIFSWFLFTFGVVGFLAVLFGFAPTVDSVPAALGLMAFQTFCAAGLLYGFRLHTRGRLSRQALVYSGWGVIGILVVLGQIWFSTGNVAI